MDALKAPIERLERPAAEELDALTDLWEASVRATHDFLAPDDIGFFRRMVRDEALAAVALYILRDELGRIAAFAGVDGRRLEMLFVAPERRGCGCGGRLVAHVVERCGVRAADVNEQNGQAVGFYARMGFRVVGRHARDASGKPYPILRLELPRPVAEGE